MFRGHSRTSTYLADTVRTLANISDNFRPGETYNIGGVDMHTIEELSDIVLKVTGASPSLVEYRESKSSPRWSSASTSRSRFATSTTRTATAWRPACS